MFLASTNRLQKRAQMLAEVRRFFERRGVLEVDVPLLTREAPIDTHIDLVEARALGQKAYLHSSPEYGMKKLLAEGSGDIYQLGHVFRDLERGSRHSVEFTMVEWYRLGFTLDELIEEVFELLQLFIPIENYEKLSYDALWHGQTEESFAFDVEPTLGRGRATFVVDFPPCQAALARVNEAGYAERFELYVEGYELANGYHELADSQEQQERLEEANRERLALAKAVYPIDDDFVSCVGNLPDCCGVAVGFDRLMMLQAKTDEIATILPIYPWGSAP